MKSTVYDCIIVGGGAAGLYCAAQLARTAFYSGKKEDIKESTPSSMTELNEDALKRLLSDPDTAELLMALLDKINKKRALT